MTSAEIIAALEATFGATIKSKNAEAIDPFVVVDASEIVAVAKHLRDDPALKFEILHLVSGVDYLEPDPKKAPKAGFEPHVEVVYHFQSFTHKHRFVVKVSLPRWKGDKAGDLPEVPTLTGIYPSADWHERETFDLVGVTFVGHPDHRRILLAEDWVGHPLRKDYEFPLEYHGIRAR